MFSHCYVESHHGKELLVNNGLDTECSKDWLTGNDRSPFEGVTIDDETMLNPKDFNLSDTCNLQATVVDKVN